MTKISDVLKTGKKQAIQTSLIKIPEYHDRTDIDSDSIEKLASNISEVGLLNPILLEKKDENTYELISGLRRLNAVVKIGWTEVDSIVLENLDDQGRMLIMIAENAQRQNLNDYDLVVSLIHLLAITTGKPDEEVKSDLIKFKNYDSGVLKNITIEEKKLRKVFEDTIARTDRYKLSNLISKLKVLNFHPDIIKAMQEKRLLFYYACLLNKIKDEEKMKELLTLFTSGQMTKDELKKEIRRILGENKVEIPFKETLKKLNDFTKFSEDKQKSIVEKMSEIEKLLSA